ncbi:MAG: Hpt domain-containing protein, partial [Pedobacter sp.]
QTPSYFEQLNQHIQDENWSGAADIAHKIKPTLAFMGVESARISMAEIEQNARNLVNLNTIPEAFNKLNDLSKELFVKLEEVKKELEQAG